MSWMSARPSDSWAPDSKESKRFQREAWDKLATSGTFTWDAPSVPANSTVDTTLDDSTIAELTGLRLGMRILLTPPLAIAAGIMAWGWVPASNSLRIRIANVTGLAVDAASGDWSFQGVF